MRHWGNVLKSQAYRINLGDLLFLSLEHLRQVSYFCHCWILIETWDATRFNIFHFVNIEYRKGSEGHHTFMQMPSRELAIKISNKKVESILINFLQCTH